LKSDHTFEEFDGLGIGSQLDHGLLPAGAAANEHALALHLAFHTDGVNLFDLDTEDLFDSLLDLDLVGVVGDLEDVLLFLGSFHGLFGDDGLNDDIVSGLHYANTSSILARAA
jgi:hypothetical protein